MNILQIDIDKEILKHYDFYNKNYKNQFKINFVNDFIFDEIIKEILEKIKENKFNYLSLIFSKIQKDSKPIEIKISIKENFIKANLKQFSFIHDYIKYTDIKHLYCYIQKITNN